MGIGDVLGKIGSGLEKGMEVAGAVAAPLGKAVANEEAGYAPAIAAEGRAHQEKMEDAQINFKAQALENQLNQLQSDKPLFKPDGTPMSPQERTQAIGSLTDQFSSLYSNPRHAGTLMEKLRKIVAPNGGVKGGAAPEQTTPAAAMTGFTAVPPEGYAENQARQEAVKDFEAKWEYMKQYIPEDQQEKVHQEMLEKFGGLPPVKPVTKPDVIPLTLKDGTAISAQWNPDSNGWEYLNGEPLPQESLGGAIVTPKSTGPKVGSLGEFLIAAYGPTPTPQQEIQGRQKWAEAVAGTTTGSHIAFVPQPDNTIKAIEVQTSSTKHIGGSGVGVPSTRYAQTPSTPTPTPSASSGGMVPAATAWAGVFGVKPGHHLVAPQSDPNHIYWQSDSNPSDIQEAKTGAAGGVSSHHIKSLTTPVGGAKPVKPVAQGNPPSSFSGIARPGQTVGARPSLLDKADAAQYTKVAEDANAKKEAYTSAQNALASGSTASSDQELIYSWVRSNVQGAGRMTQAEFRQALSTGSLPLRAQSAWERTKSGKLPPELEKMLLADIKRSYEVSQKEADDLRKVLQPNNSSSAGGGAVENWVRDPKTGKLVKQ